MRLLILALCLALQRPAFNPISRDAFGVPHIRAAADAEAWFLAGEAVAQDRLWQMEMSRRVAEGRMAEVFGAKYVAADEETLKSAYTQAELRKQFDSLAPKARMAISEYTRGVNARIDNLKKSGRLPDGYAANHFAPRPWDVTDSVAIAVSLFQRFGKGASGQLRNLAAITYLESQPALKPSAQRPTPNGLDAFDDLAWWNDEDAPTTVQREDEPGIIRESQSSAADFLRHPYEDIYHTPYRGETVGQLAKLPKLSLFELLPALRAVEKPDATELAAEVGAPFKVGSYAMVVSPKRSTTGHALLLNGPQMGFSDPSVVHEMSIDAPSMHVTGMDVPGVPGVVVGVTPNFAWGLTSGVADTDDVFVFHQPKPGVYLEGDLALDLEHVSLDLPVAGESSRHIEQLRTNEGPVILSTRDAIFARRASYWMREMKAYETVLNLYQAKTPDQIEAAIKPAPMSFNFFYATTKGDTGFVYVGDVPRRSASIDPRLPTPSDRGTDWRGMIPKDRMPHVRNPRSGLITNWNTKPAVWWPNLDTPVWGEIDHVLEIRRALDKPKLGPDNLRQATRQIATADETWPFFKPYATKSYDQAVVLRLFNGQTNSDGDVKYLAFLDSLRHVLFQPKLGTFLSPDLFHIALQPTLILRALQGKTKVDYLAGRSPDQVISEALAEAAKAPSGHRKDQIDVPGSEPILYRNRGTFIQIVDLAPNPIVRTILPPGEAESGPHATDQAELARSFDLKPPFHPPKQN